MITQRTTSILHLQNIPTILPSNPLYRKRNQQKPIFTQQCAPKKSLSLYKIFSQNNRQNWLQDEEDNNIIGDCIVFEDGIFEDQPIPYLKKQKKNTAKEEKDNDEEESLVPEEWRDLQRELNVSKKERKKRMQRMEFAQSFQKKREIELFREGLSEYNTIKLPSLNFTNDVNSDKRNENVAAEAREFKTMESESVLVSVKEREINADHGELTKISSVRDENEEIRCVELEQASKEFSVNERVLNRSEVTEISSVRDEHEEISCVDVEQSLESLSGNERVLKPREATGISSARDGNEGISCFEVEKPLERFSANERVLNFSTAREVQTSVGDKHKENLGISSIRDGNKENSANVRVSPRNPRLHVVGIGFEEISKRLEEYKVEDGKNTGEEEQKQERQQLYTPEEKVLLNARVPDLQRATSAKWIPLHTFATAGQSYLLDFLLTHDVDINAIDKDGRTALHKVISCKKEGIASYLLKARADALVRDGDGATLIHYAVEVAAIQTIKLLILHKVDINMPDNYGWTPLHLAVQSRRTDVVRLLLVKGAHKSFQNKDGNTPLDLCLHSGRNIRTYELIRLLKTLPRNNLHNSIPLQALN